jgi:hypothetical protein
MRDWLPEYDFGVMSHGFAPHGRDYIWIIQTPGGTHELTLTHVVDLRYETHVLDKGDSGSWDDRLTDYTTAYAPGAPSGYVWGTNWSLAYPGLEAPDEDPKAKECSERAGRPMFAMAITTDRFRIAIIFHGSRSRRLSDDTSTLKQGIFPLSPGSVASPSDT